MKIPYITLKKFLEDADSEELIQYNRSTIIQKRMVENIDWGNGMIKLKGYTSAVYIGIMYKKILKEIFR